eukprot:4930748-Pyramimonas_sp.AAC.1
MRSASCAKDRNAGPPRRCSQGRASTASSGFDEDFSGGTYQEHAGTQRAEPASTSSACTDK